MKPNQTNPFSIIDLLKKHALFYKCSRLGLSRLIPNLQEKVLKSGEQLYSDREHADQLFLVLDGAVNLELDNGKLLKKSSGLLDVETSIGISRQLADSLPLFCRYASFSPPGRYPSKALYLIAGINSVDIMCMFQLPPYFVPALIDVLTTILLALPPQKHSCLDLPRKSFFMALSILG